MNHEKKCKKVFFFNDTATTEIYTLSLHDALPISRVPRGSGGVGRRAGGHAALVPGIRLRQSCQRGRSEEHTSELQSRQYLVCRLLLEKKKQLYFSCIDLLFSKFALIP